jgi:flagellar basal-body rod protein FlgB
MQLGTISEVVAAALDGLALRQQVTAQNLANLNTPGYAPRRVEFENALRDAATNGASVGPEAFVIKPVPGRPLAGGSGTQPELSQEVAVLADTALRYQTLIKGINKQLALVHLAISEGKG